MGRNANLECIALTLALPLLPVNDVLASELEIFNPYPLEGLAIPDSKSLLGEPSAPTLLKLNQIAKSALESAEFDTHLLLESPLGEQILEEDNGAEEESSQFVVQFPEAAQYRSLADSHDASFQDTYWLAIAESSATLLQQFEQQTEANRLLNEGAKQFDRGDWNEALLTWQKALEIYREFGDDRTNEATTLQNLGQVNAALGNNIEALEYYEQSLAIKRELGNRTGEARNLRSIGSVSTSLGNYVEALEYYERSLVISREISDRLGESRTLHNIGEVNCLGRNHSEALRYFEQSLAINHEIIIAEGRRRNVLSWEALPLNNIGLVNHFLEDYPVALDYFERSLIISREVDDRPLESTILHNIDLLNYSLGNYPEAQSYYAQSLVITQELGDRAGEAKSLNNIGVVYHELENYLAALDYYEQSLVINREIGDRTNESLNLNNIGIINRLLENYSVALEYSEQSLLISREVGDRAFESYALKNLGKVKQSLGNYVEALEYYEQSLVARREIGHRAGEAEMLANIGLLFEQQEEPVLAIILLKEAINVYEIIREGNQALEKSLQGSFIATIEDNYRALADLLLQQDRILEAQRILDLLRVQELDGYVRDVRGNEDTQSGIVLRSKEKAFIDRYYANQSELIQLGREQAEIESIPPGQRTPEQKDRIKELRRIEQSVLAAFRLFFKQPEIVTLVNRLRTAQEAVNIELSELNGIRDNLRRIQKAQNQTAVIFYPLVLDDRLELVLVTPDTAPLRRTVNVTRTELNRAISQLRYALEAPGRDAEAPAQKLYNWLIRSIEADLAQANADTIIYSPDLRLRYVPLKALHSGENWLIEDYQINNITAASLADLDNASTRGNVSVLAAAFTEGTHDVELSKRTISYSGLSYAGPEVDALAKLIPDTVKRLNEAFDTDIIYETNDYRIIHLATHAAFNPGALEDSYILFGNEAWVTMADVGNWSLTNVELIVLSACETALGEVLLAETALDSGTDSDSITGEEILGFGYLMQKAGAEAAMGSLWRVDDGGTQILMSAFYDALSRGGLSKAGALQQAQRDLIRLADKSTKGSLVPVITNSDLEIDPEDLSHPHYWAPFVLIGNGL